MAFFFDDEPRPRRRGVRAGWTLLLVAILGTTALAWMPSSYVIQQPGTTFDTLGSVTIDDEEVELIEVPGETVYPTEGSLRLLTVGVVGSRRTPVPWLDIVKAWFDPSKAVIPVDVAYPMGQTVEQSNEENALLMNESQQAAAAAALQEALIRHLDDLRHLKPDKLVRTGCCTAWRSGPRDGRSTCPGS